MKPPRSDYDWDALMIYSGTYWLNASTSPDYQDLGAIDVYRHGRELSDEQDEARKVDRSEQVAVILESLVRFEIPAHLDYRSLTPEQDRAIRGASLAILLPAVEQAWHRRLKDLPFPVRVDGTRFLFRTRNGEWEEDKGNTAALEEFAKRCQGAPPRAPGSTATSSRWSQTNPVAPPPTPVSIVRSHSGPVR